MRLLAPASKVVPFFEGLVAQGEALLARPMPDATALEAVRVDTHAWYLLAFEALRRGFADQELRGRLNMAGPNAAMAGLDEAETHRLTISLQLEVIREALDGARAQLP